MPVRRADVADRRTSARRRPSSRRPRRYQGQRPASAAPSRPTGWPDAGWRQDVDIGDVLGRGWTWRAPAELLPGAMCPWSARAPRRPRRRPGSSAGRAAGKIAEGPVVSTGDRRRDSRSVYSGSPPELCVRITVTPSAPVHDTTHCRPGDAGGNHTSCLRAVGHAHLESGDGTGAARPACTASQGGGVAGLAASDLTARAARP